MPAKPRLRVVDTQQPHPRDIARTAVAKAKNGTMGPIVNQHAGDKVRPTLRVDEVLRKSEGHGLWKK